MNAINEVFSKVKRKFPLIFSTLKTQQIGALIAVIAGEDVLCILPTGYGKSAMFYLPPLMFDEIEPTHRHKALVISPLCGLMTSQCASLNALGIRAYVLGRSRDMSSDTVEGIKTGNFSVLFMSPEILQRFRTWRQHLETLQTVSIICVDEVHLMETWGDEFRPCYNLIHELKSYFTTASFMLLTATCTPDTFTAITTHLHLAAEDLHIEMASPDRPNICLHYKNAQGMEVDQEFSWYIQELKEKKSNATKTLLYVRNVTQVGQIYKLVLHQLGDDAYDGPKTIGNRTVVMYHAGLDHKDQKRVVDELQKPEGHVRLVICTVAFGMGINISDIGVIIHWGGCDSVLEYWQEVGRAGRDGSDVHAYYYVTPLSLMHVQDDMKQFCSCIKESCMRIEILKRLSIPPHDFYSCLAKKTKCSGNCRHCMCAFCICCSYCRNVCVCSGKVVQQH